MNEKERIIELVKQGVISMDEALRLLEAGGTSNAKQTESGPQPKVEKSQRSMDSVIKAGTSVVDAVIGAGAQVFSGLSEVGSSVIKDVNDTLEEREQAKLNKEKSDRQDASKQQQEFVKASDIDGAEIDGEAEVLDDQEESDAKRRASECQTKGQLLSEEIDALNLELQDLQQQVIVCQQRQREFEIYAELDELTPEMEEEVTALEEEEAALVESIEAIEEELDHLLKHQEKLYDQCQENQAVDSEFQRFIKNSGRIFNEQANNIGAEASREGKRMGRQFANFVRDGFKATLDRLGSSGGSVSFNTPWTKTTDFKHQYLFDADKIEQIDIDSFHGDVELTVGDSDQVILDAHFRYNGEMETFNLETIEEMATIDLLEDTLVVHSDTNRLAIDAKLQVPAKAYHKLSLASVNGDIKVKGLETADLEIESQRGDLNLQAVTADQLSLESTNGDILMDQVHAESAEVELVSGDIRVNECELDTLSIQNVNGDIRMVGAIYDVEAETVNGDCYITKENLASSHLEVENVRGDIKISFPASQGLEANLETRMGDCKYRISQLDQENHASQGREVYLSRPADSQGELLELDLSAVMGDIYLKDTEAINKKG